MSYYYPLNVHLEATGSNADEVVLCFHERIEVIACKVVAIEADVTGHAANFAEIKVIGNDKATELFKYSTATGAQGTLTADAPADLIDLGNTDKAIFEAGTALKVRLGKSGAGVTADVGVSLQIRQARKY